MRDDIAAVDIANEIRMARDVFSGTFLIVEGETADLRLYGYYINRTLCRIIPSHGSDNKDNAIQALAILEGDGFAGVLAIVDADFWRLEGIQPDSPNLFITDTHDLETMVLKSPALEKLLIEYGSKGKIEKLTQNLGKTVCQILLDAGSPIGYLRLVSRLQSLSLCFRGLTFSRFVDDRELTLEVSKLVEQVKNKSQGLDLDANVLVKAMANVADDDHDLWDVCCGHDLVGILSLGLRKALGSHKANDVKRETLEKFLRAAYEVSYFIETRLCQSLKDWEARNRPFLSASLS
jgi:hypothetical protein